METNNRSETHEHILPGEKYSYFGKKSGRARRFREKFDSSAHCGFALAFFKFFPSRSVFWRERACEIVAGRTDFVSVSPSDV